MKIRTRGCFFFSPYSCVNCYSCFCCTNCWYRQRETPSEKASLEAVRHPVRFGDGRRDSLGQAYTVIVHPDDQASADSAIAGIKSGGNSPFKAGVRGFLELYGWDLFPPTRLWNVPLLCTLVYIRSLGSSSPRPLASAR